MLRPDASFCLVVDMAHLRCTSIHFPNIAQYNNDGRALTDTLIRRGRNGESRGVKGKSPPGSIRVRRDISAIEGQLEGAKGLEVSKERLDRLAFGERPTSTSHHERQVGDERRIVARGGGLIRLRPRHFKELST